MRKLLLLSFFAAITATAYPQDFSNKGKDFWICYPAHIDGTLSAMGVYITSDVNTSGSIQVGSTNLPFTITANTVVRKFITNGGISGDASNAPVYLSGDDVVMTGAGIHVISDRPVAVYAHIIRTARSGATLVLPVKVWGKEYVVPSYRNVGSGGASAGYGEIAVMASQANTLVEITPSVASRNGLHAANTSFTITLPNPGDVYQLQFQQNADISGTIIKSIASSSGGCKPIAVYSATTWSAFDCANSSGGDNLYQQIFPTGAWGKKFITAPFITRPYDIIRVFVKTPATVVRKMENGIWTTLSGLSSQNYYEVKTQNPLMIEADQPISVVQYMISQTCSGCGTGNCQQPADPEMVVINPLEQTINNITVFSAHRNFVPQNQSQVTQCFLNIILPNASINSFRINGSMASGFFNAIPGTNYSYLQENVTNISASNPVQTISADSGFIAIAYGYGQVESYGYNAGTNVTDLYQYVTIENEYATVNFPAGCRNSPLKFSMTFPYQPLNIKWEFGALLNSMGIADTTIVAPVPDSSWTINGRTLYKYKLSRTSIVTAAGTYPIKVVADNPTSDGCSGEQEINYDLQIFDPPASAFSKVNSGCLADSVVFADQTDGQGRPLIRWSWNFGDGSYSTIKNPTHKYNSAGDYTVKFSTITDVGCISDTAIQTVSISDPPVAKFEVAAPFCEKNAVTFTDQSTSVGQIITKWTWTFGDGGTQVLAAGDPVTHIYQSPGNYTVTLLVETGAGCKSAVYSIPVSVHPNPKVDFQLPSAVCLPEGSAQFVGLSTISDASESQFTYAWDFGDGGNSAVKDPVHIYGAVGPYTIKLTVTSKDGCVRDTSKILSAIYSQPRANFSVSPEVCLGNPTVFTDASNGQGNTVSRWRWQFGDGATDTTRNPNHIYAVAGSYSTTLYIYTDKGCISDTATFSTIANPLPVADFKISNPACETRSIDFSDLSVPNVGVLNKWNWDFGDGNSSTQQQPTHVFSVGKIYNVSLGVESSKGCKSSNTSRQIVINYLPRPDFQTPAICLTDPFAQFTDKSTIPDNSESQFNYAWSFDDPNANGGNPNSSVLQNPQHRYSAVGVYDVRLTVTSKDGCVKDTLIPFTVNGSVPQSVFSVNNAGSLCSNQSVSITNNSTVDFGSIVKIEVYWDYLNDPTNKLVDNSPSPNKNYSVHYPDFGAPASKTYQIRLVSYSGINCVSQSMQTITVNASPQIQFDLMASVCEEILPYQLTYARETSGLPGNGVFSGAGVNSSGVFDPHAAKPGLHTIRYTFNAGDGCTAYAEQSIRVLPTPMVNAGPDRTVLEGGYIFLNATASGNNLTYLWTPALGVEDVTVLSPKISPSNDITYRLTVNSADGCEANDEVFVKVLKQVKVPNVFTPNNDGINDKWEIQYLESYPGCEVDVFNRYGQKVFHSTGYSTPWDGKFNGAELPVGTYYWIINPKNGRKVINGSVSIIR